MNPPVGLAFLALFFYAIALFDDCRGRPEIAVRVLIKALFILLLAIFVLLYMVLKDRL